MSKATDTHTTSRRAVFALAGSTILAGAVAAAPAIASNGSDAALIALTAEFCALERQHRAQPGTTFGTPEYKAREAEAGAIMERQEEIANALLDTPATTLAGHQAIARALDAWADPEDYGRDEGTAELLIGALLRGLVGRVPEDEPRFIPPPAAARAWPDPDAALIALCTEHMENWHAVTRHTTGNLEDCPHGLAYIRTLELVTEARAQTFAGMMAKAAAAKLEARNRDGTEDWEGTIAGRWGWDLIGDLTRFGGQAFGPAAVRANA